MDGSLLFMSKMEPGRAMNRGPRLTASGPIRFPVNTAGLCTGPEEEKRRARAGPAYSAAMPIASDQGSRSPAGPRDARTDSIKAKSTA